MPVSTWREVVGKKCQICGGTATHYYGDMLICCGCHVGEKDGGLFTEAEAQEAHAEYLQGVNSLSDLVPKQPNPSRGLLRRS